MSGPGSVVSMVNASAASLANHLLPRYPCRRAGGEYGMRPIILALSIAAVAACSPPAPRVPAPTADRPAQAQSPVMAWPALLTRPRPTPTRTIAYGTDPLQVADLWLPAGKSNRPHPTVLMVHGGCWTTDIADRSIMNWIADDLAKRGGLR